MTETIDPFDTAVENLDRAQAAFDLVHRNASMAAAEAEAVLADSSSSTRARSVSRWCLGRVHHDSGDVRAALAEFGAALAHAEAARAIDDVAQIRMSMSTSLALSGDTAAAIEQLSLAEGALQGEALGRLYTNRAYVLASSGDMSAAILDFDRALPLLRGTTDLRGESVLMLNRGVALVQLGRTAEAKHDFEKASELAEESDQHQLAAMASHNLGYLEFVFGRTPSALRHFALARERYGALGKLGRINAALDADECTVLLAAGFADEAHEIATRLVESAKSDGNQLQYAEGLLLLARASLAIGDEPAAIVAAEEAAQCFQETGREPWAALAQYVAAISSAAGDPAIALERLRAAASTLERLGWRAEAAEVQIQIGQLALRIGDLDLARATLSAAAGRAKVSASGRVRAAAWHATALLQMLDDQRTAAKRSVAAGLRVIDAHRASLGASDMRVRASADGVDLAQLGLRLAMDTGRPVEVFRAAERWRAGALARRAPVTDADENVAQGLAEMRRLERRFRKVDGDDAPDVDVSRAEFVRAEREITKVTRMAAGDPRAVAGALDLPRLRSLLGDAGLVEYIDLDGRLYAVVVNRRRTRLVELPAREQVLALRDHLGFALRRLVGLSAGHRRAAAAIDAFHQTAGELDDLLVAPLHLGEGAVVIVPTGPLHAVPWSALASLRRPEGLTIAPSAAWWLVTDELAPTGPRGGSNPALLVHGPDLPYAPIELDALSGIVADAHVLRGDAATVGAVLDAMAGADLVHIAAHGRFRADNPMFSSLQMTDGSIYVHDLQRLRHTPETVVLTACSAGRTSVYSGDELLGTGAALLSLGVRSVIAPLVPVRDESTAAFAVEIHRHLAAGRTPSQALSQATIAAMSGDDPGLIATAAAFQCVGRCI